jgi:hypothetical protein
MSVDPGLLAGTKRKRYHCHQFALIAAAADVIIALVICCCLNSSSLSPPLYRCQPRATRLRPVVPFPVQFMPAAAATPMRTLLYSTAPPYRLTSQPAIVALCQLLAQSKQRTAPPYRSTSPPAIVAATALPTIPLPATCYTSANHCRRHCSANTAAYPPAAFQLNCCAATATAIRPPTLCVCLLFVCFECLIYCYCYPPAASQPSCYAATATAIHPSTFQLNCCAATAPASLPPHFAASFAAPLLPASFAASLLCCLPAPLPLCCLLRCLPPLLPASFAASLLRCLPAPLPLCCLLCCLPPSLPASFAACLLCCLPPSLPPCFTASLHRCLFCCLLRRLPPLLLLCCLPPLPPACFSASLLRCLHPSLPTCFTAYRSYAAAVASFLCRRCSAAAASFHCRRRRQIPPLPLQPASSAAVVPFLVASLTKGLLCPATLQRHPSTTSDATATSHARCMHIHPTTVFRHARCLLPCLPPGARIHTLLLQRSKADVTLVAVHAHTTDRRLHRMQQRSSCI